MQPGRDAYELTKKAYENTVIYTRIFDATRCAMGAMGAIGLKDPKGLKPSWSLTTSQGC
jgi:hypothetical protein